MNWSDIVVEFPINERRFETASTMADDDETEQLMRPIKVIRAEMPDDMQAQAFLCINKAMDQYKIEKDIATHIKKHFDENSAGTWHCVLGKTFGASICHETKYLLYL